MSSLANYDNPSTSAPMSESDNDDENEYDSSFNKQNESMMHKVKDVVSKLLHPSFLFSANDDTNRPKRKRSTSEEKDDEQETDTITTTTTNGHITTSTSKYRRSPIRDDEPQLTDDEDNNSRDVPSTEQDLTEIEQPTKRRRTADYRHILSPKTTNGHHEAEGTSSSLTSTNTTPVLFQTYNERINRLTSSKQRYNIPSTYRGSTPNYDPLKSPLFSVGKQRTTETTTTTNLKSNEFSANYLLATSLVTRPQPSTLNRQQSPATLTKPVTTTINNNNQLLSNERQMFGVNYASINSRRLPYIERLRRRTLQDCIRLNRTLHSEPLSISTIEEHKSTTTSPTLKRTKPPEKECGIQCDISIVESSIEPNKKIQRTFPPADIQNEALLVPTTEKTQSSNQIDSSIQTNSSITIEKIQPTINITKPKVLGNVTPFSWPKFARAQEEYAKKYPEKCRSDAVVPTKSVAPTIIEKSNINITPTILQQTNTSTSTIPKMPIFPFSSSCPAESIWKCPSCTKEHPAQTASCSLCHGINPNYKKLSVIESRVTAEKEPVPSRKLPDVIAKESSVSTPTATITNQTTTTTTKENVLSIPPAVTTSVISTTFPLFGTTPNTSLPATTKENSVVPTAPITTSSTVPLCTVPIVSSITTTKENPVSTNVPRPLFGTTPIVPLTAITKENPATTDTSPLFSIATTKENPVTTSAPFTINPSFPIFGTTPNVSLPITTKENPVTTSASNLFQTGTTFPSFASVPSTSLTTTVPSSTAPSIATITPSIPISTPFGPFGSTPIITTTTTATPVVSTASSNQSAPFTFIPPTSATSLITSTFDSSTFTPAPAATTTTNLAPVSSITNAFPTPSTFPFTSTTTTSAPPAFGSSGFGFSPTSTIITSSNPSFGFGAGSPPRPSVPTAISSINSNTAPSFGINAPFGIIPTPVDKSASSVSSFLSFGSSNAPSTFGFAPTSNTTINTIQTSAAPVPSTGGFSFAPQPSTVPVFGAGPPALSSSGLLSPFNFGGASTVSTSSAPFQFLGTTSTSPTNNPFSTSVPSASAVDTPNPFDISSDDSTTTPRIILKGKRRVKI